MPAKKILVVEDDPDLLRGLKLRLEANAYSVLVASEVTVAVSTALKDRPDLLVLDIGLRGGDGFLIMQRLRSIDELDPIPAILITGQEPSLNRKRAQEECAFAYFQKPFDNDDLLAAVRRALGEWGAPTHQPV